MTTERHPAAALADHAVVKHALSAVGRTHRRRRPSGAPPPLPRSVGTTGWGWLVALGVVIAWTIVASNVSWAARMTDRADAAVLRQIVRFRTDWLTSMADAINRNVPAHHAGGRAGSGSEWALTAVAAGVIVLVVVFKRWRHLLAIVVAILVFDEIGGRVYSAASRPRPYDVTTIGTWAGLSPARGVAVVTLACVGICYSLVPAGRPRTIAKTAVAAVVVTYAASRLYLAIDHPFDVVIGVVLAVAVAVNAFRFIAPNDAFPVSYRRGKTAHLDVTGRRAEAIRRALRDQLGLTVVDMKPVGLAGSGGSTPLRLRVAGDPDSYLFGKLYAINHVRADRLYKAGRTILYGSLEDEAPFQSVQRLVQYEDYAARLMRDAGIPTATPFGSVELTPGREYMFVTEFFDGGEEIGDVAVDDALIDQGLALIRHLWDAGVAHRDIKPANLLVKDGRLLLIDVAFAQVHPSPWREAVDLANMMLVLAVRTDARRVYQRALQFFTPDEIAEAFAATRGFASPSQLRAALKQDGRDLVGEFRALAPERRPMSLQRWGVRRVAYIVALLIAALFAINAARALLSPSEVTVTDTPTCGTGNIQILMAQAVPTATSLPCIASLPAGWEVGGVDVHRDHAEFWLDSDRGGRRAVEASLRPPDDCSVADATEVPSDEVGMRRYEQPEQLRPNLLSTRYYLFDGGCVVYRFSFASDASPSLMFEADNALTFQPRATLVDDVNSRTGLRLCGAGAPPCPGGR